jgi:hypothetical protein
LLSHDHVPETYSNGRMVPLRSAVLIHDRGPVPVDPKHCICIPSRHSTLSSPVLVHRSPTVPKRVLLKRGREAAYTEYMASCIEMVALLRQGFPP